MNFIDNIYLLCLEIKVDSMIMDNFEINTKIMHMYQVLENDNNNVEYQIANVQQRVLEYTFIHSFSRFLYIFREVGHTMLISLTFSYSIISYLFLK